VPTFVPTFFFSVAVVMRHDPRPQDAIPEDAAVT